MSSDNASRDLRSTWQNQEAESFSVQIEALRKASVKFNRKIYWRNIREYFGAVIVLSGYGYYIYHFHNPIVRIGSAMIIAAALWVSYRIFSKAYSSQMGAGTEGQACIDFHRAELIRQRDLQSTVWTWYLLPFTPGLLVFLAGFMHMALSKPGARHRLSDIAAGYAVVFAVCAGTFIFLGWLNKHAARKLQKKIDALDALKGPHG